MSSQAGKSATMSSWAEDWTSVFGSSDDIGTNAESCKGVDECFKVFGRSRQLYRESRVESYLGHTGCLDISFCLVRSSLLMGD